MNKEEAKQLVRKAHFNIDDPNREGVIAVDKIYDDFEKQQLENIAHLQIANDLIEKLEKKCEGFELRTCETCRWFGEENKRDICIEGVIEDYNFLDERHYEITKTFGCNKWEDKDAI